jgi:hypothetical protein
MTRLAALVADYDTKWSALDVTGVARLWEDETPQPVYIGDEYATPLIGIDRRRIRPLRLVESMELHGARIRRRAPRHELDYLAVGGSRRELPDLSPHGSRRSPSTMAPKTIRPRA